MRTRAYILGFSHAWCMQSALARNLFRPDTNDFEAIALLVGSQTLPGGLTIKGEGKGEIINPALTGLVNESNFYTKDARPFFVSVYGGNHYNWLGLIDDHRTFDFVHPDRPDLPVATERRFLPYAAVRANFDRESAKLGRLFELLRSDLKLEDIVQVEGPPPIPSDEHVTHWLREKVVGPTAELRLGPKELRLKLWTAQRDSIRRECERRGVTYITPPEEAIDADGYLREEYWLDSVHGTPAYGALLLKKVERTIRSIEAGARA